MTDHGAMKNSVSGLDEGLVVKVIQQHLQGASQFVELGQYRRITIQANRMITDAALWAENPNLVLPGLVLRLSAIDLESWMVSPRDSVELPQKNAAIRLLANLNGCINGTDSKKPWEIYADFYKEFWGATRSRTEGRAYTASPEFVTEAFNWHFTRLNEWAGDIGKDRGMPLDGIVNELSRITKTHGCTVPQLASHGVLQVLLWWCQYVVWRSTDREGNAKQASIQEIVRPRIDEVYAVYGLSEDSFYDKLSHTCKGLLMEWRSDFIRYYDFYLHQESRLRAVIEPLPSFERGGSRPVKRKEHSEERE